jgi:DMSO/TMAO reductase YedYZ heme-binding membrane subunit
MPDHLLFICMLALAAARRRPRALATVQSLALLTAMFTVGHSVSLALAALGWVMLPSRWVKTGIAITITIALAALNATA